ncbi:hypothetical protein TNCV_4963891 [Trichonephila clavipes]|nr:hypothetical protein TNCV_4963891 [Trichonephila clavipes]
MSRISKKTFDSTPRALNAVSMRTCYWTHKRQTVVYLQMLKTFIFQAIVGSPTVQNDCGTRQHPFFNDSKQTFFRSTWNHSEKTFVRIPYSTSKHPFSFQGSSPLPYFIFPNLLSSTSTIASTPPILQLSLIKTCMHTSLQKLYQSTAVCEPTPKSVTAYF